MRRKQEEKAAAAEAARQAPVRALLFGFLATVLTATTLLGAPSTYATLCIHLCYLCWAFVQTLCDCLRHCVEPPLRQVRLETVSSWHQAHIILRRTQHNAGRAQATNACWMGRMHAEHTQAALLRPLHRRHAEHCIV